MLILQETRNNGERIIKEMVRDCGNIIINIVRNGNYISVDCFYQHPTHFNNTYSSNCNPHIGHCAYLAYC